MDILVPVDGSDCSMRALAHAIDLAEAVDGTVDVVHFTEFEDESTEQIETRVDDVFAETGVDGTTTIVGAVNLSSLRASDRIGRDIVSYATDNGADHIVMGHHGSGYAGRFLLGSAAETVVSESEIPVTIIP